MREHVRLILGFAAMAVAICQPAAFAQSWHHLQGGIINKVVFIDEYSGWAVEDGGRIRYTVDGGATWNFAQVPDNIRLDLNDVQFLDNDPEQGWAVGDGGVVLKTVANQGGAVWTEATSPSNRIMDSLDNATWDCGEHPANLTGIFMTSASSGFAVGYDGAIAVTTDNWLSWSRPTGEAADWGCDTDPIDSYDIHFFEDPSASSHFQKASSAATSAAT